jgi:hypothetical protein
MKEDILEQVVDEYLQHLGYFTRHNIKFRPDKNGDGHDTKQDSAHSDIDILAVHPSKTGQRRVLAVSCKSWQSGFYPARLIGRIDTGKKVSGRDAWKGFRELATDKWSRAFLKAVKEETGADRFVYITAVTSLKGDREIWEQHSPFLERLKGNPVEVLTLEDILTDLYPRINKTPAASSVGRLLQLVKASGWGFEG